MPGTKGRSGRRAKPTARKVLAGNPGHRPLNQHEPQFSRVSTIDPPQWLPPLAVGMWEVLCRELCLERILAVTDVHNLEVFCCAYSNWRQAQDEVNRHGVTISDGSGNRVKNPAMTSLNEASRQMATFGSMLGLDPASRQRLTGDKPDKTNRFAEF